MDVTAFYDSSEAQSLTSAATLKLKFPAISLQNTKGLNEASIDALIAAISDDSQHRVYILVDTNVAHATGDLTDAQAVTLADKLYTSAVDPDSDNAVRDLGEAASSDNPCLRTWENTYPNKTAPLIVYYQAGVVNTDSMADYYGTSTGGSTTTLADTGQTWTVDALIGKYVYCISGTGVGQYGKITDNDATSVTVAAWLKRPIGSGKTGVSPAADSVYRIVPTSDRYFVDVAIPYYIVNYLADLTDKDVMDAWRKLLDKEGNFESNNLDRPTQDLDFLNDTVIAIGAAIYDNSIL